MVQWVGRKEEDGRAHCVHQNLGAGMLGMEEQHHNMVSKLFQGVPPAEQE